MSRSSVASFLCTAGLVCGLAGSLIAGDRFLLIVPNAPDLSSQAERNGDELIVVDAAGEENVYLRAADFDTRDYLGFYCRSADRYLRWPVRNAGGMQVGTLITGKVVWTPSKMQVRPAARPGLPPRPENFPGDPGLGGVAAGRRGHIASVTRAGERSAVAYFDAAGLLHLHVRRGARWGHETIDLAALAGVERLAVPHAPLAILAGEDALRIYTVGLTGALLELTRGVGVREVAGAKLAPGSELVVAGDPRRPACLLIDARGRLLEGDVAGSQWSVIDGQVGRFEPGSAVATEGPGGNQVFLVDRAGNIVTYEREPVAGWHGPELAAAGFVSGSKLAVWRSPHPDGERTEFAGVDRRGRLVVFTDMATAWQPETITGSVAPPGAAVTVVQTRGGLGLTLVTSRGVWAEWRRLAPPTGWEERTLAEGFAPGSAIWFDRDAPGLFGLDATDRAVGAWALDGVWQPFLLLPEDDAAAPRIVKRKTILGRQIDPVRVSLVNTHSEELIVRVLDARLPDRPQEFRIPPGERAELRADRDAGGSIQETFVGVDSFGRFVEQVRVFALPPQPLYDVVVYESRVQFTYVDRRKKRGPVPDFQEKGTVSLGAFQLPPGELLADGAEIDVYRAALEQRNPGASALIGPGLPRP